MDYFNATTMPVWHEIFDAASNCDIKDANALALTVDGSTPAEQQQINAAADLRHEGTRRSCVCLVLGKSLHPL